MYNIGFILEQGLGHRTHTLNLQANVPKDRSVQAIWGLIAHKSSGWATKVPFYNRYWTIQAGLHAQQTIRRMQQQTTLDALFFHTQVTAVLATNWLKRIPSIVSLDATPIQYDALGEFYDHQRGPNWLEQQKWRLNYNCFRHAKHLVAWSHWAKQGLIDDYRVPPEKVSVIPPGITVKEWLRPTPMVATPGPIRLLFVGGNLKRKGGLLLLEAFRTLWREMVAAGHDPAPALELHMVTHEPLPAEPGLFAYHDMVPNSPALRALFQQCDIFCLPTYGDCLPIALIEASAAGLPSITTRVGGTAEVVTPEQNGFLIEVGDVAALVQTLRTLIANPELRLRQSATAMATASQRFDAEQTTYQLLTLLKRVSNRNCQVAQPGAIEQAVEPTDSGCFGKTITAKISHV